MDTEERNENKRRLRNREKKMIKAFRVFKELFPQVTEEVKGKDKTLLREYNVWIYFEILILKLDQWRECIAELE